LNKTKVIFQYRFAAPAAAGLFLFIHEYLSSIGWMSTSWFPREKEPKSSSLRMFDREGKCKKRVSTVVKNPYATIKMKEGIVHPRQHERSIMNSYCAEQNDLISFCGHFSEDYSVKNKILSEHSEFILFRNRRRKIAERYKVLTFCLLFCQEKRSKRTLYKNIPSFFHEGKNEELPI